MKRLLKIFISLVLIFAISFSIVFFQLDSQAGAVYTNTFVPSEKNFSNISQDNPANQNISNNPDAFMEFNELTIDKEGFYLRIDKIGLFKAIIPDVDPRNKEEYVDSWNSGISHGKFTSKPDKIGITYLFAHAVTNKSQAIEKNAWFTYADQLEKDDEIIIYYKGIKYHYNISSILAVSPTATAFYTGASVVPMVRMQYCGPPTGSIDSRTIVDALLTSQEPV
jgi:sortase (surface protein transpeptidase)